MAERNKNADNFINRRHSQISRGIEQWTLDELRKSDIEHAKSLKPFPNRLLTPEGQQLNDEANAQ